MTDNRKRRENSGTLIQLIIVNEQVTSSIEAAFQRNDISQQLNLTGGSRRVKRYRSDRSIDGNFYGESPSFRRPRSFADKVDVR